MKPKCDPVMQKILHNSECTLKNSKIPWIVWIQIEQMQIWRISKLYNSSITNSTNFYIAKFRLLNNLQLIFKYLFFYFPCVPNVFQNNNFFPETVASSVIWLGGRLSGMKLQTKAAI